MYRYNLTKHSFKAFVMKPLGMCLTLVLLILFLTTPSNAQETSMDSRIGEFFGYLHPSDHHYYDIPNLHAGDIVYLLLENSSGNLDPYLRFSDDDHEHFIAEDDDSGNGSDSVLVVEISTHGTYTATVATCCKNTFGEYRLVIGINAPQILDSVEGYEAEPVAFLDMEESQFSLGVQEFLGAIEHPGDFYEHELAHLTAGHTLYIYAESLSEGFVLEVELKDFQRKVLVDSIMDENGIITIEYPIMETGDHYDLVIESADGQSTGDYRLLIGIDAPQILTGQAEVTGDPIIREPFEIQIGFELLQITGVDQQNKNFGIVGIMRAEWTDHAQAFDASDCQCVEKTYADEYQIFTFLSESGIHWPDFRIVNQQEPRDIHNEVLIIHSDGRIHFEERFSVTLQAPEFDFRRFPFDHQEFWLRIETRDPDDFAILTIHPDPAFNRLSQHLGEEEWIIDGHEILITDENMHYRFNFDIQVERHATFYFYRILVPLFLIVLVGWAIFLIHDYDTQIAAASGNLLIFIAFNFTIADELPRLGYLTFMDSLLLTGFVVSVLIFGVTLYLKRLATNGREDQAQNGDKLMLIIYPSVYLLAAIVAYLSFFVFG
jgi:hypothetical protein